MKSRVTIEDIQAEVVSETYTLLPNGRTTICQITLRNGFTVEGKSACVSVANFNAELGNNIARDNAIEQMWQLLGFRLADKLALLANVEPRVSSEVYIGTKAVHATPMTRLAYNQLRGWDLPADENGDDKGFLVEYADGQRPNVPGYAGYVSWSPADVFERAYQQA